MWGFGSEDMNGEGQGALDRGGKPETGHPHFICGAKELVAHQDFRGSGDDSADCSWELGGQEFRSWLPCNKLGVRHMPRTSILRRAETDAWLGLAGSSLVNPSFQKTLPQGNRWRCASYTFL